MPTAPTALTRNAGAVIVALVAYVVVALVSVVLINMVVGRFIDPMFVNLWACLVSGGLGVGGAYWTLKFAKATYSGRTVFLALAVLMAAIVGLGLVKLQGQATVYWVEIGAQVAGTLVAGFFGFWRQRPAPVLLD